MTGESTSDLWNAMKRFEKGELTEEELRVEYGDREGFKRMYPSAASRRENHQDSDDVLELILEGLDSE